MPETEMLALGAEIKRLTELQLAHLKERDKIRIRRSQYYDQVTGIDGYDEQLDKRMLRHMFDESYKAGLCEINIKRLYEKLAQLMHLHTER